MMIRVLTISALMFGLLAPGAAEAKTLKIGVVHMQRAVSQTKDGKRAEKRLTRMKKKLENQLNGKMKRFYAEEKALRKSWAILKDSEKRKRAQASQKRFQMLRKEYLLAERKLMKQKAKALQKISRKLSRIIQRIAKRDRYDYIFNNVAVLWAPQHVDLTNEVIRLYNR
jgi:outer membrane protein